MSLDQETVVIKSQKSCVADLSPLRSVENQLDFSAVAGSRASSAGRGGGGSPRIQRPNKMNNSCHNNNINIVTHIHTEPFSDFYTVDEEIGRGKFAVVKRCRNRQNGKEYAAKFLRKRRKGKDCRSDVIHEISMLELCRKHPRLVDLVEVFETSHELIIITEYASGGELYQHVVVEERIEEREVRRLMRQVLDGLLFLHDRNIVHLDVKPQNVLLTDRLPHGDIKLCDLGFARKVYSGEDVRDIIGTPDYVAPEVLSYEPIHTASDMWSSGVLAYVMLTGYSPFAGDTKQETFLNISQVNIDFPDDLFEDISELAQEFIMRLLCREPSERMTARECLNHPWLQSDDGAAMPHQPASPFGSPVGQRRALTPPAANSATPGEEPLKKCRLFGDVIASANPSGDVSNDIQRHLQNETLIDVTSAATVRMTTAATHVQQQQVLPTTPCILTEDNNNLLSSPGCDVTTKVETERKNIVTSSTTVVTSNTATKMTVASSTNTRLPQGDIEQEIIC